ncbi:MAG TPA: hypothetical protein VKT73_15165 [Xanthobacteraceae bacterium]|nr:hypothetical protein [Xanthobacteraceae bacterium]
MAGIKLTSKISTKVPMPKGKGTSSRGFLKLRPPKQPSLTKRIYTKAVAKQDPSEFGNSGFGDTGLTGES